MNKPTGGRGKKAPYESTHLRVPVPIKGRLQEIIDDYRNSWIDDNHQQLSIFDELERLKAENESLKNQSQSIKPLTPLDDAIINAKSILRQKKSKVDSMAKLLTGIYGIDITSQDLLD